MTDQLTLNYLQPLDTNGNPLPNGTVQFYQTGTLTAATGIYQDAAKTAAYDNPASIDGAGRIPQIFTDAAYGVRAIIRDSAGTTVADIDPLVRGSDSSGAASGISIVPTTNQPASNVEDAINTVADNIANLTTNAFATLGAGTADDVILTSGRGLNALPEGLRLSYLPTVTNTGAMTFAVDGLSAVAAVTMTGEAVPAGYIRVGQATDLLYDGTNFVVDRLPEVVSNSNGVAEKRNTNRMTCSHSVQMVFLDANTLAATWTYPAAFSSVPRIKATLHGNIVWSAANVNNISTTNVVNITTSSAEIRLHLESGAPSFVSGDTITVGLDAEGAFL